MSYLKRFPVDILKIDRSFIAGLSQDENDMAFVRGILGLGQALSLVSVAEGVETKEVLDALAALGCDDIQGYFISKPQACEPLKSWFSTSLYKIGLADAAG